MPAESDFEGEIAAAARPLDGPSGIGAYRPMAAAEMMLRQRQRMEEVDRAAARLAELQGSQALREVGQKLLADQLHVMSSRLDGLTRNLSDGLEMLNDLVQGIVGLGARLHDIERRLERIENPPKPPAITPATMRAIRGGWNDDRR